VLSTLMGDQRATEMRFEHHTFAQRVVFGPGVARTAVGEEVARVGGSRVLLIVTTSTKDLAASLTKGLDVVATFDRVRPHVPVEVAAEATELAQRTEAEVLVSVGGGSTTGTAKVIALTTDRPIVAIPTTYSGSEATPVWGRTEAATKITGVDPRVLPRTVVYDPELTLTLPTDLTIASALNAMAHCIDSLWAPRANPILSALATEGISALATAMPALFADGSDLAARSRCLYAAYLAGSTFASAGSGLHHKICHVLGGMFDLPHAQTHAVVLPHVLAFNGAAVPEALQRVGQGLNSSEPIEALLALYDSVNAPRALRDLGMPYEGIESVACIVVDAAPERNPAPVTRSAMTKLLRRAWSGDHPSG
jgi:alcohol dehydrogenase class IV